MNDIALPSSLPVTGEASLDLLPNLVAPSPAGYISSESHAVPMVLGCGVTSMPDACNPTVGNITAAPPRDLGATEIVDSISPAPNADASPIENNGLTQPQTLIAEIAQHTRPIVTNDVSVDATTNSLSLPGGNAISISDARDIASSWPSPMKELHSAINTAISMTSLGATLSPRKDLRDLTLEAAIPAALQYVNVSGDFSGGVRSGEEFRKDASAELGTQPRERGSQAGGIDRSQSDVAVSETNDPSMDLPSQSSSPLGTHNDTSGVDKLPPNTVISKPEKKTSVKEKDTRDALLPGRANKSKKSTSKGSGEMVDATLTPRQIIERSFAKYFRAHIPLNFYHGQPDLSQVLFDPNGVILGDSQWETRLVLNDDDLVRLPNQLKEITQRIPSKDDSKLIQLVQGNIKHA
ncbi:hypothetical protein DL95DRAFT_509582, partial [Leptodontidium sp. 2 PMI_412]